MTSLQQRAELHRQIWDIANDVRGSVDGWDFKQYVLGVLFYHFISENFPATWKQGIGAFIMQHLMTASLPTRSKTVPSGVIHLNKLLYALSIEEYKTSHKIAIDAA